MHCHKYHTKQMRRLASINIEATQI